MPKHGALHATRAADTRKRSGAESILTRLVRPMELLESDYHLLAYVLIGFLIYK